VADRALVFRSQPKASLSDAGIAEGLPWSTYGLKLVLAGEVFSEDTRSTSQRA
jgi:hypothetical protein